MADHTILFDDQFNGVISDINRELIKPCKSICLNTFQLVLTMLGLIIIIVISLLMSPLLGHRPSLWITHKGERAITHHACPVRVDDNILNVIYWVFQEYRKRQLKDQHHSHLRQRSVGDGLTICHVCSIWKYECLGGIYEKCYLFGDKAWMVCK
jgi:hypothetical protein